MSTLSKYIRQDVELNAEDGMLTMTTEFALDVADKIEKLEALQVPEGLKIEECPHCKGRGEVGDLEFDGYGYFHLWSECGVCRGTGKRLVNTEEV